MNKKKDLNIKEFAIINNIKNEEISKLILNMLKLTDKETNGNFELTQHSWWRCVQCNRYAYLCISST